jgi:large subunit ribosomal protein L15
MPHKLRKIRKFRGSRTQGYGRIGQHRDSGSKGHRKVGRHKHLWSLVVTQEPGYFGKNGFTSPQSLHSHETTINLKKLEELAQTSQQEKTQVNLTNLGYTKLLGTGKVTKP